MADSTMHFTFGLVVGTCIFLPAVIRKLRSGTKCTPEIGRMIAVSYAMAIFAIIPNLLRHSGFPQGFCNGWWMNLFFLNPLIDSIKSGGMLIGEIMVVMLFIVQYSVTVLALIQLRRRINP